MISINRRGYCPSLRALGWGVWAWALSISAGLADDLAPSSVPYGAKAPMPSKHHPNAAVLAAGTLGYGPPGYHTGFQGFGLGYHLGYGYGGASLGVGAFGGYPHYGGPGYPHPWPTLNRFGPNRPFCYYGGPGGPSFEHPYFYGTVGPLAPDRPVVIFERNPNDMPYDQEYGYFTGSLPYPESTFAPFATIAGSGGSYSGVSNVAKPPTPSSNPPSNRSFGVDGEPIPDAGAGGLLGLKILGILPGSISEKAGLRVGDVLLSINGQLTQRSSDLFTILENSATAGVLKIRVRTAADGKPKDITVRLP